MGWETGDRREFKFDPNSTEGEGRWRLYDPQKVDKRSYFRRESSTAGVSYVMGRASAGPAKGDVVIQAVRFDKEKFSESEAAGWWSKNHGRKDLVFSDERKSKEASMDRFERLAGKVAAVAGKVVLDVPLSMREGLQGELLPKMKVTFDGKWFGFSVERGPSNEYSDEAKFVYSLGQELRSSGNALKLKNALKEKFGKGSRVSSEVTAARPAIELVEKGGAMFESEPRYMVMFQGKPWGELYFNMRGYVAERGIPVPSSSGSGVSGLQIGERSLAQYKSEISKANREWARKPMVAKSVRANLNVLDYVIRDDEVAKLRGVVDEQTYDLAEEVYRKLYRDLELTDAQTEAVFKLKRCVQRGSGMAPEAHRNEIFKAAHALGMKLPSFMF